MILKRKQCIYEMKSRNIAAKNFQPFILRQIIQIKKKSQQFIL